MNAGSTNEVSIIDTVTYDMLIHHIIFQVRMVDAEGEGIASGSEVVATCTTSIGV